MCAPLDRPSWDFSQAFYMLSLDAQIDVADRSAISNRSDLIAISN